MTKAAVIFLFLGVVSILAAGSASAFVSRSATTTSRRSIRSSQNDVLVVTTLDSLWPLYQQQRPQPKQTVSIGGSNSNAAIAETTPDRRINNNHQSNNNVLRDRILSWCDRSSLFLLDLGSSGLIALLSWWQIIKKEAIGLPQSSQLLFFRNATTALLHRYWFLFPLSLCLVPVYTATVLQTTPVTPEFWKLVNLDSIFQHSKEMDGLLVVAAFLGSNISYFVTGAFLFLRQRQQHKQEDKDSSVPGTLLDKKARAAACWVLAAGTMSTVFHTVQAIGDYSVAEALCYLDHGVAGTATLYFWRTFSHPSRRTLILGVAGMLALAINPSVTCYAFLHSLWHFLSAAAAVAWIVDAPSPRRQPQQHHHHQPDAAPPVLVQASPVE